MKIELIGYDIDNMKSSIDYINKEYKLTKIKTTDSLLNISEDKISILVKIEDKNPVNHIRNINEIIYERFGC